MTRFARAEGSKSSNKKVAHAGTPWSLLKNGLSSDVSDSGTSPVPEPDEVTSEQGIVEDKGNVWSVIDGPRKKKRPNCKRAAPSSKNTLSSLDPSGEDKEVPKAPEDKLGEDDVEVGGLKQTAASSNSRKKKNDRRCFKCQKNDHVYKDCPENDGPDAVCFNCGSTEHGFRSCKRKGDPRNKFAFAQCFICKERGHISTSCPDNPSGLYPYGGGCRECGDVTHFVRDCPKRRKRPSQTLLALSVGDVDALPEDGPRAPSAQPWKKAKVVKF